MGNEFGECHAPYTLKISYIDFEKGYTHCSRYKRLHFKILHNSPFLSSGSQKTLSHSSFIFVELVLVLNMHEILELDVKQTINLPNTFLISFTDSSEPVMEMKLYMVWIIILIYRFKTAQMKTPESMSSKLSVPKIYIDCNGGNIQRIVIFLRTSNRSVILFDMTQTCNT